MKSNTILILITAVTTQQRTTQLNRLMKWQMELKTILPYNLPANDTFEFQPSTIRYCKNDTHADFKYGNYVLTYALETLYCRA